MKAQIRLPVRNRHVGEHAVELGEKLRLRQREAFFDVRALRGEERRPRKMRRRLIGFGNRDEVVLVLRIAKFHARQRGRGEARFELHDDIGLPGGIVGGDAGQLQRLGDVLDIGLAQVGVVVLAVVVRCRQSEAALERRGDLRLGVVVIGARAKLEHDAAAAREILAQKGDEIGAGLQSDNLRQVRLDRIESGFLDCRFVHA